MRRTRASFWVLGITAVATAVLFVLPITPKVAVESVPIVRGELIRLLSVEGTVTRRQESPALVLANGLVSEVCVRQGETVQQGQLLLRLDTTLEESTLERLARLRGTLGTAPAGLEAVTASSELELLTIAEECRQRIATKQVRAAQDGVVGQVYAQPGAYAAVGEVAMTVYQPGLQVTAVQRAQEGAELALGTPAIATQNGACAHAALSAFGPPVWEEALGCAVQTLTFDVEGDASLRVGSPVELDILCEAIANVPVAPLRALTAHGTLWVIREGKAYEEPVNISQRDAERVRVPDQLLGLSVILEPNTEKLENGVPVKERRR